MKTQAVLYVHGMGGSASEAAHYGPLFPDGEVTGLNYKSFTPWETGREIREAVETLSERYGEVILIANSIGAFFSVHAGIDALVKRAYFISPVVDMESLIRGRMAQENVTEEALQRKGTIRTASGPALSWDYLCWVRSHPVEWQVPTAILYGACDALTPYETIAAFAKEHDASLTVMEGGEHWFHTEPQMRFLDAWISGKRQNT